MFSTTRIVLILALVSVVGGAFLYFSNLQSDLQQSEANNETLKESIEEQQKLVEQMQEDFSKIREANQELREESQRQQREISSLSERINVNAQGENRDFASIAATKPELVERLINRGTRNAMRCLELASGAERTEEELNAETNSEINQECPELANPNYEPQL